MPFISAVVSFVLASAFLTNVVIAVGLALVQKLLAPKRKKQDTDSLDASQQVQRQLSYAVPREVLVGDRITGGVGAFNDAYGTKNEYGVSVTVLSSKPCNSFVGLYLNGDLMTLSGDPTTAERNVTSHFLGLASAQRVKCRVFLGDDNSALGAYLATKFPTEFSTSDNFNDMCVAILECRNTNDDIDPDTGESSIPFQGFPKAKWRMQGAKVCDPRIALSVYNDESTYVYSDNAELIAAQADFGWHTGEAGKEKSVVGNDYPIALLDLARIESNADFCDTKGYTCAGRIRATAQGDLEEIRKCYNAIRVESPSQVYNVPEAHRDAAVTIDMSLYPAARVTNANRQGYSSDVYNSARTFYQEPAEQFGKRDLPINFDQALIDADGGVIRELELPLNFVTDGEQAANLEKEELAISRAAGTAIVADLPPKFGSNRILKVGGLVTITNSRMAWMNGLTFCVQGRSRSPDYDVALTLQKFAGATALSKIAAIDLPDLTPVPMPTIPWVSIAIPYVPTGVYTDIADLTTIYGDTLSAADSAEIAMWLDAAEVWSFGTTVEGFGETNDCTLSYETGGGLRVTPDVDAADVFFRSPVISVDGSRFTKVLIDVETVGLTGHTTDGAIYFKTDAQALEGTNGLTNPRNSDVLPATGRRLLIYDMSTNWAGETINKIRLDLIQAATGGYLIVHSIRVVGVDTVAPITAAQQAALDAAAALADRLQTGLDRTVVRGDFDQTALDRIATGVDLTGTNADVVSTGLDLDQTFLDALATAADRVVTGGDVVLTDAQRVLAAGHASNASSDAAAAALDLIGTNADAIQTGLDLTAVQRIETGTGGFTFENALDRWQGNTGTGTPTTIPNVFSEVTDGNLSVLDSKVTTGWAAIVSKQTLPIIAGTEYRYRFKARMVGTISPDGSNYFTANIARLDSDGLRIDEGHYLQVTGLTTSWQEYVIATFTPVGSMVQMRFYNRAAATGTGSWQVKEVELLPQGQFYDAELVGSFIDTNGVAYVGAPLGVGAVQRLGVGVATAAIALQAVKYSLADGDTVTFADKGEYEVDFDPLTLDPLATDEAYQLSATSKTGTGFTATLKISTLGAATAITESTNATTPTGPVQMVAKVETADATNGVYEFYCSGTINVTYDADLLGYFPETGTVESWFHNGTSWVPGPSMATGYQDLGITPTHTSGTQAYSFTNKRVGQVTYTGAIRDSATLGTFGADVGTGVMVSITNLNSARFTKQAASGTRTATPNAEKSETLVSPTNVVT